MLREEVIRTFYPCLYFGSRRYFAQLENTIFHEDLKTTTLNQGILYNCKLNFRYVAILQSGSFVDYKVSKYPSYMTSKKLVWVF